MAIARVGGLDDEYEPDRVELGRIQVSIDDLQALRELLTQERFQECGADQPGHLPDVEFSGGTFTDSEDLRRLSDEELRLLRVRTIAVEVILADVGAVAIGDEETVNAVYREWARPRQVKPRIGDGLRSISLYGGLTIAVLAFLMATFWYDTRPSPEVGRTVTYVLGVVSLVGGVAAAVFEVVRAQVAKIVPMTLAELRINNAQIRYPRNQTRWMALTALITAVGIVVSAGVTYLLAKS